jgi:nucleotide-binding universal stress UspA family protein
MPAPFVYQTIAVASTFSPRFLQVLAEAKRIRERFDCELRLIYVGQQTEEATSKFGEALRQVGLPAETMVHYEEGDPADAILRAIRRHKIDMIVAGALEKQVVLHPFLGNVARQLVRDAQSSVLLFTHPQAKPQPLRQIVFMADDSPHALEALKKTLHLAAAESTHRLHVVRVMTPFDAARAKAAGQARRFKNSDAEETALEEFVLSAGDTQVPIEARCIRGNTGFAAADFVQSIGADLLVVPAPASAARAAGTNIAWLADVIPCNLWLIR